MKKLKIAALLMLLATLFASCSNGNNGDESTSKPDIDITTESETTPATETTGDAETDGSDTTVAETDAEPPASDYAYQYYVDVEQYLPYICTQNSKDFLTLANRLHPVGKDFKPTDLVDIGNGKQVRENVKYAFDAMVAEMTALGVNDTWAQSCYRSYSYQENLYTRYKNDEKKKHPELSDAEIEAIVNTYSAKPGTSDHQLGMAIDFYPIEDSYEKTKAFKYMKENAHKFGFILRFPKGKEHITGYSYEPWHWRFVGREAATFIYENNLTLEEYMALIDSFAIETFPVMQTN